MVWLGDCLSFAVDGRYPATATNTVNLTFRAAFLILKIEPALFDAAAMQVGFDLQPRPTAESRSVALQVFHDPLHIVARLGERDVFDPVDRVDLGIARMAVTLDPLFDAAAAGIVSGEGPEVGAAVVFQPPELGGAARLVVEQPIDTSTAAGKAFLDMLGVFAEFETNLRKERQLEGIADAEARGVYKGRRTSIHRRSGS